ncbi:MAG: ABC transporter ATP-binding protein/permease [Anaerolineaceae bacterium]|nr:ABC transporter ATP-binding protein/permease [Anaerolineaceae bacterium]
MQEQSTLSEFTISKQYESDRRGPARWIFSHAIHQWRLLLMAFLGAFGNAALFSITPIIIGRAFNLLLGTPGESGSLALYAWLIVGSQLVRGAAQFMRNYGFELVAQKIELKIREELYVNLLGKSMTFHSLQSVGDMMARATNDVREVNFLFSPGINLVAGSMMFLVMPLVLSGSFHPQLLLTPIVFTLFFFAALWRYLKVLRPISDDVRSSFGKLNTRLSESLDGIETVKGAAQEVGEVMRFGRNAKRYRDAVVRQGNVEARFVPLLFFYLSLAVGLLHALLLFNKGAINLGDVVGYFGVLMMLDFPTFISLFAYSQISSGLAGARRILELLNKENKLDQNAEGHSQLMRGEVEFRNVCFYYEENEPILKDVSFKVKPGQTVAIVGQTGSGKTSLIKLINRIYDVTDGQVLVDGVDVRNWNLESLRTSISIIEQDIFLFSRTVEENIAFGYQGASHEKIEEAAKAAQAHEFILLFDKAYQTVVGERGATLSGGQRQRLALARAFLADPKILVLDDSTSAIDSATEDLIQQAIFDASRGRTTFIITHRLSQIRLADLILVMGKGKLEAVGTHEELLQSSPIYQRIFTR